MTAPRRWHVPLYLRIWLAVIAAVAVIAVAFGWIWRETAEPQRPPREIVVRNEAGEVIGVGRSRPHWVPGQGVEFPVTLEDGRTLMINLPPRPRPMGEGPPPPLRPWMRGPNTTTALIWLLAIVTLAVAVGAYPIVRRLTTRLERLRADVDRWGQGDLGVRMDEGGHDEVAALAQRFNEAAERVQALVATHKSLLANASHELRSPLARIRMGLELMGHGCDERARDEILRNLAELDQLIGEILLASRLDARESDVGSIETVDLTGLAAEECAHTGATLEGQGAVAVQGIAKLLRRAVRNLLENARRYSDGPVDVTVQLLGDWAEVRVSDRGPGVPEAQRERIFEPFYRLPGASEREGGVGLGLALVRSIATRHHGSVRCEGREGGGASFVLRLPLQQP